MICMKSVKTNYYSGPHTCYKFNLLLKRLSYFIKLQFIHIDEFVKVMNFTSHCLCCHGSALKDCSGDEEVLPMIICYVSAVAIFKLTIFSLTGIKLSRKTGGSHKVVH